MIPTEDHTATIFTAAAFNRLSPSGDDLTRSRSLCLLPLLMGKPDLLSVEAVSHPHGRIGPDEDGEAT